MRNEQRNMMNFKLISFIIFMLICSGIAIADQKVISSEDDFTAGSFSGMQLNIEPTSTLCNYRYISSGYDFYTSGQHSCDICYACNGVGSCTAQTVDGSGATALGCTIGDEGCRRCNSGSCTYYTSDQHSCSSGNVCDVTGICVEICPSSSVTFNYMGSSVTYGTVENPTTGKCWLDRNLGASQVATAFNDYNAYGDLFQWGRLADGHQTIVWTSSTASDGAEQSRETSINSLDVPGHDKFISDSTDPWDWRDPQNDNLWQGVSGINNPCPSGWRIPTNAEWRAEYQSWTSENYNGAFGSPLKLPVAGHRVSVNGGLLKTGIGGYYWSSNLLYTNAYELSFLSTLVYQGRYRRARGDSIRCVMD